MTIEKCVNIPIRKFFKGCLPQPLLGPFLKTLSQIYFWQPHNTIDKWIKKYHLQCNGYNKSKTRKTAKINKINKYIKWITITCKWKCRNNLLFSFFFSDLTELDNWCNYSKLCLWQQTIPLATTRGRMVFNIFSSFHNTKWM